MPSLIEHRCSVGERGGFFERLDRGTYLAHILEHVVLELQTLAGSDCGFGRTRESNEEGVYKVAIEYDDETLCRAALEAGRELCLAAVNDHTVRCGRHRKASPRDLRKLPAWARAPAPLSRRRSAAFRRGV